MSQESSYNQPRRAAGHGQNGKRVAPSSHSRREEEHSSRPPQRRRRRRRAGAMGALLYVIFVLGVSALLAGLGWTWANDILALNKEPLTAVVTLPDDIFTQKEITVEVTGEDGKKQTTAVDYRGKKVPFVPAHTMSLTADYRIPVSANGLLKNIIPGANLVCNGPTYWDAANEFKQDLYAVLGAHLTFDFGCFDLDLWGRNLTDTGYNTFLVNSSVDGVRRSFAQRGTPLQVGIDVRVKL